MNKVILMGRLTRDPEVRYSQHNGEQMAIARFSLAVDRRVRKNNGGDNQQNADFISCTAFGRQGEFVEKYLHKGTKISLIGRIQTGSYTNKDGNKVYTTDVIAEELEFAESKNSASQYNGAGNGFDGASNNDANKEIPFQQSSDNADASGFMNLPQNFDDAPF